MQIYAGIGSRKTPPYVLNIMTQIAVVLAKKGYVCHTGACIGADQAFAEGALQGGGQVHLLLPWSGYESNWVQTLNGSVTTQVYNPATDVAATESVKNYHPAFNHLSRPVVALHARNYLIINQAEFCVCWTPDGLSSGGTGQAIRIAQDAGIPVYNLGLAGTMAAFVARLMSLNPLYQR